VADRFHFPLTSAAALSLSPGSLAADVFAHGTLSLEYYAPRGPDTQKPHERDEVYIIASGSGWLRNGDVRHHFETGDALFVPAGAKHGFEDFSKDFGAWVIFYGPAGGER
jgi:mannose-6-phosphate isomerase-like protein (cupin superfamily)